jgi:hypothetical protein
MAAKRTSTIVLEFHDDDADALDATSNGVDVRELLHTALADFIGAREGVAAYVAKRYAHMDPTFRRHKTHDVQKRVAMAKLLRCADVTIYIGGKP